MISQYPLASLFKGGGTAQAVTEGERRKRRRWRNKRPERVAAVGRKQGCFVRRSFCRTPQQECRNYDRTLPQSAYLADSPLKDGAKVQYLSKEDPQMAKLLLGKEVNEAMVADLQLRVAKLRAKGIAPTLAILRVGENASDLAYEKGAAARAEQIGVEIRKIVLPETAEKTQLLDVIDQLNADESVHGVLMLRPLPLHLRDDQAQICNRLDPRKDVDCMTQLSNAGVFTGCALGFAPCTAAACMEILDHYGIDCTGKNAAVIGRSPVVGKPAAMMLLQRNATVTVCHTKTANTAEICRNADIIISAAGKLNSLTRDFVREGQVVIDVSMNWDADKLTAKGKGGMSGDAVFYEIEPIVAAITPVPGGVGAVTTSVLMKHVVEAAEKI